MQSCLAGVCLPTECTDCCGATELAGFGGLDSQCRTHHRASLRNGLQVGPVRVSTVCERRNEEIYIVPPPGEA